jgi:predicted RNA-binding protein with PIN domain
MRYLIDGHNLIPQVQGLSLELADDEQQLIIRLLAFCREGRHQVEVYFDGTPPEHAGPRKYGAVSAVFVRRGLTADDAIRRRLHALKAEARQWTLVSSDAAVQAAGREAHAEVLHSDVFAQNMQTDKTQDVAGEKPEGEPLNPDELEEWLRLFGSKGQK